jgi:hypothetical protein
MHPAIELPTEWRVRALALRRYASEGAASAFEECADNLEEAWRIWQTEPITLEEAAEESGYSYSTLQQKVASGEIPNLGNKHRPRVGRADLPRKAPHQRLELESGEPDLAAKILAARL